MNFAPELTGVGKYSSELVDWLAAHGHSVRVIAAPPYYPEWRVRAPYSAWRFSVESDRGCKVFRCPVWVPKKPTGLKRLLHLFSFAISSFLCCLGQSWWRPDVVWAVEPSLLVFPAALMTARLSGAKTWAHIQDFEIDAAFELDILPDGLRRFALAIENFLLRRFDRVSTISDNMLSRLQGKQVSPSRTVLFPNWIDTDAIFPLQQASSYRAQLGIPDGSVVALYSGSMAAKQGFEPLLEAIRHVSHRCNLYFVFCGEGPSRAMLTEACKSMPNVHMLPLQPLESLNQLLNLGDFHLLPQRADAADLVMPAKLLGMFSSGRPVITTAQPDTQLARTVHGRGVVVPPDDAQALVAAIEQLAADAGLRKTLGKNARDFAVASMNAASVLPQFERNLLGLCSREAPALQSAVRAGQ